MHIHILGICGTFMAGLARLAKDLGYTVTGSDAHVYPPMSDVLSRAGIQVEEGYHSQSVSDDVDLVVIGNAMSRGNLAVEAVLNKRIPYVSGPEWLYEHVLKNKHVIAVSGTHGKTTTTAMLSWILYHAGYNPGFLIGGLPKNFDETARLGGGEYFVIEADEYDTAFFDKQSKFMHYRPNTLIINNLEFDHADIFDNLAAIQKQFQFLLRTVPACGAVIYPAENQAITDVLSRGCWSKQVKLDCASGWHARALRDDCGAFEIFTPEKKKIAVDWACIGEHNMQNAMAAAAAAYTIGLSVPEIKSGLATFQNVKRRMEVLAIVDNITIYDDFAHHPTAIELTLKSLRAKVGNQRIIVLAQLGSNTMEMGVHEKALGNAFKAANEVHIFHPKTSQWSLGSTIAFLGERGVIHPAVPEMLSSVLSELNPGDHVLIISNKGFEGLHQRLIQGLREKECVNVTR